MVRFILKRIGYAVLTLWVLVTLTFFMMHLLPGEPFSGERKLPETTTQALKAKYGLDKPMLVQYGIYILNVCKGDLGNSLKYNRPVTDMIGESFPYSFELGMRALIFAVIAGLLLGIVAAVKRGTKWDTASMLIAIIGVSVPSFIVGALLQYGLSLKLNEFIWMFSPGMKLFPVGGWATEMAKVLPALALGLSAMASISRLMRTSTLDVLGSDYIKTAKAKGLNQNKIIRRHVVRNAVMPIVTILGPTAAAILTGGFVVESIFNIPGMGKFFVQSVQENDFTMIAGTTLFYGAFLIGANLIVDIVYCLLDPRIKLAQTKGEG